MEVKEFKSLSHPASVLLSLLIENHNKWLSQEDICHMRGDSFTARHNNSGTNICPKIWTAVNEINENTNILVIISDRHYKIATKQEANEYLRKKWYRDIQPRIDRINQIKNKIAIDGTVDLTEFLTTEQIQVLDNFLRVNEKGMAYDHQLMS